MPTPIKLEALTSNPPVEILRLSDGTITMGREPENDVVVDSGAVSRRHCAIIGAQSQWVFKDLESSNGSWVNGVRLNPGQLKLLRNGDVIQVADFPIRVSAIEPVQKSASAFPSILVFYRESFEVEFPLATVGSRFTLGGSEGHFFIESVEDNTVFLEIVNTGRAVELHSGSGNLPILVNGLAATGVTALTDRSEVVIEAYRFIISDERSSITPEKPQAGLGTSPEPVREIRAYPQSDLPDQLFRKSEKEQEEASWVSEASRRKQSSGQKFLFGSSDEVDVNATGDFGSPGRIGPEMSASQRFSTAAFEPEQSSGRGFGETFLIIIGVVIFILLIVFAVYLVIAMSSG